MMVHRSHGRGTPIIDREFREIGRIRCASGTNSPKVLGELNAMLTGFKTQGRWDLLTAIRDKQITPLYAYSWFKQRRVDEIPTADVLPALGATWDTWVHAFRGSLSHRASLRKSRRALGITGDHIVNDLPGLLAAYRLTAPPHSSNQARVHAQAFLRDTLGKSHRLWIAVKDMIPAKKPKSQQRPIPTVDEVRRLVVQLGDKAGKAAWSMAAMGMLPKEYWKDGWEELPDRIRSYGQKREGRTRDLPRWTTVYQPPLGQSTFVRILRKVTGGTIIPRDFRRCFARWIEEAGVIQPNQRAYMGHGARTMTQLYTDGEVRGQIEADAEKLRGYTGEPSLVPALKRMA